MSVAISDLLMGGSIRTAKSGVLLEKIDRVEFDRLGRLRIRGYVSNGLLTSHAWTERWTILDQHSINLFA